MKEYDLIGLHHDAVDPHIFVPKRVKVLGRTINVGHRRGLLVLVAIALVVVAVATWQYG